MSLKTTLVSTACMLGGFHLAKQLTAGTPKVLMYHRFSDGEEHRKLSVAAFSRQIEILKRGYNVLTISAICEAMRQGQPIPKHTIAITVDDGYDDFYRLLDRDSLRAEIQGSKTRIEQMLLQPINAFCYPNGQREDYNDLVKQVVIESGFSTATAAFHDKAIWEDYHEIRRYSVWNDLIHFRKVINGVETLSDRLA
jgi:peptidoglycan/xylan/chitin deacetylase (PgdA/CDA1 family)